ncbi:MAG: hypothetical protein ACKVI4_12605 [Actinomycetales bacterium]
MDAKHLSDWIELLAITDELHQSATNETRRIINHAILKRIYANNDKVVGS